MLMALCVLQFSKFDEGSVFRFIRTCKCGFVHQSGFTHFMISYLHLMFLRYCLSLESIDNLQCPFKLKFSIFMCVTFVNIVSSSIGLVKYSKVLYMLIAILMSPKSIIAKPLSCHQVLDNEVPESWEP